MTKLFKDDAYLKEFKAKIISIIKEDNCIELGQTAFYAKSGGQPLSLIHISEPTRP